MLCFRQALSVLPGSLLLLSHLLVKLLLCIRLQHAHLHQSVFPIWNELLQAEQYPSVQHNVVPGVVIHRQLQVQSCHTLGASNATQHLLPEVTCSTVWHVFAILVQPCRRLASTTIIAVALLL